MTRDVDRGLRREVATTLRKALTRLGGSHRSSNDDRDDLHGEIVAALAAVPREPWVLDALDEVVGENAQRRRDALVVMQILDDVTGVEGRMRALLDDPDDDRRLTVLQTIHHRAWPALVPLVAERLPTETDHHCRRWSLLLCGRSRSPGVVTTLMALAAADLENPSLDRGTLLFALREHGTTEARPYFEAVFAVEPLEPRPRFDPAREHRVLAAWGLCALDPHPAARSFLAAMLDDPPVAYTWEGGGGRDPGVSGRAAQALASLLGMPAPGSNVPASVVAIKARLATNEGRDPL